MVELEQVAEPGVVALAALQLLDQRELPLDQRLAAPGQVDEHGVDVGAQLGLVARQPDGLAVHLVEGARDLADLVLGEDADGRHLGGDHAVARLAQVLDEVGQPLAGDLQGLAAQAAQGAYQGSGHAGGDEQHDHEQGEHGDGGHDGLLPLVGAQRLAAPDDALRLALLDLAHGVDDHVGRVEPLLGVVGRGLVEPAQRQAPGGSDQHQLAQEEHAVGGPAVDVLVEEAALLGGGLGGESSALVLLPGLLAQEALELLLVERALGQHDGDQRLLVGQALLRAGEPVEHARLAEELVVHAALDQLVVHGEQVVDDRGVELDGRAGQQVGLQRLRAQGGQVVQPVEQALQLVGGAAGGVGQELLGDAAHLPGLQVHLVHLRLDLGQAVGRPVTRDVPGGPRPLAGDEVGEAAEFGGEPGELVRARVVAGRGGRGEHLDAAEQHGRGGGHHDEGHETCSDAPIAQPPAALAGVLDAPLCSHRTHLARIGVYEECVPWEKSSCRLLQHILRLVAKAT